MQKVEWKDYKKEKMNLVVTEEVTLFEFDFSHYLIRLNEDITKHIFDAEIARVASELPHL